MLDSITPVLLTHDEAPNITRALAGLGWAKQIVVVDSGSTDGTLDILKADSRVRLFHRDFDNHFGQWSFAMNATGITTSWFLRLDADYALSDAFVRELAAINPGAGESAFIAGFDYAVLSQKLIASLYPPKPILFRLGKCAVTDLGHTEGWKIDGSTGRLSARVLHDDWKSMDSFIFAQTHYMRRELEKIETNPWGLRDWLRRHPPLMPIAVFFYCLFGKGLVLNGRAGILYTLQRVTAEVVLALMLLDKALRRKNRHR